MIGNTSTTNITVHSNPTAATSTTTGALQVTGGAGIAGNVFAGNVYTSGLFWAGNGAVIQTGGGGSSITYTAATAPPVSGNIKGDQWYNTTTDTLYEYITDGTSLYWVDTTTPSVLVANVTTLSNPVVSGNMSVSSNVTVTGNLIVNGYSNHFIATGSLTNTSALTISGNVYGRGGIGYLDAITLTNSYTGATNPNKWIRMNSTGGIEIINNAYSAQIFSISDGGIVNAGSQINVNGLQAVNGPAFSIYLLTGQVTTSGTIANVLYNGKVYDTHNCFNTTTGVFTPNVAGYYQFNWTAGANTYATSSGIVFSSLYKNNQEIARGARLVANTGGMVSNGSGSCYLNGTTDYVQIKFDQASGSNATLEADASAITNGGSYANYFSGQMVRGA